jgi:uncharacterized protein (DUF433 family)
MMKGKQPSSFAGRSNRMENIVRQHIIKTPGVCGGKACIAGHRIRVMDVVVWHERRGMCPEEIVHNYPGITLADVHAALAYYFDNHAEIEADLRNDEDWAKFAEVNYPSLIKEKLGGRANPLLP